MSYVIVKNHGTKNKPNQQASIGGGADVAAALRDYNDEPLFNEDHEINPPPRVYAFDETGTLNEVWVYVDSADASDPRIDSGLSGVKVYVVTIRDKNGATVGPYYIESRKDLCHICGKATQRAADGRLAHAANAVGEHPSNHAARAFGDNWK
jgi:hypothetical protein